MSEEIVSFSQIISNAFDSIKIENAKNSVNIYDEWKKILSRIKTNSSNPNEGLNMAGHSRVIDLKNGILLIEADHPGWISLIQFHKKYILNGNFVIARLAEMEVFLWREKLKLYNME